MRDDANTPDLQVSRRSFLLGLASIGLLPLPPASFDAGEVELIRQVQATLGREPLHLLVDHNGTIELANYIPCATRLSAYDVAPKELELDDGVYDFLDRIEALRCEIYWYSQIFRDGAEALEDWDTECVAQFIDELPLAELESLRAHLFAWFSADVTLEERNDGEILRPIDGRQWAFQIFGAEAAAGLLDALKIVVVDGEAPGSTHFAAELQSDVDEANRTAARLALPIVFENCRPAPKDNGSAEVHKLIRWRDMLRG